MNDAKDTQLDELDEALHRAKEIADEIGLTITWETTIEEIALEMDRRARLAIL